MYLRLTTGMSHAWNLLNSMSYHMQNMQLSETRWVNTEHLTFKDMYTMGFLSHLSGLLNDWVNLELTLSLLRDHRLKIRITARNNPCFSNMENFLVKDAEAIWTKFVDVLTGGILKLRSLRTILVPGVSLGGLLLHTNDWRIQSYDLGKLWWCGSMAPLEPARRGSYTSYLLRNWVASFSTPVNDTTDLPWKTFVAYMSRLTLVCNGATGMKDKILFLWTITGEKLLSPPCYGCSTGTQCLCQLKEVSPTGHPNSSSSRQIGLQGKLTPVKPKKNLSHSIEE